MATKAGVRIAAAAVLMVGGLGLLGGLAGCKTTQQAQGQSGIVASYGRPTLTADLGDVRPPAVLMAAEEVMRSRGYTIVSSEVTEYGGDVSGRPPRYSSLNTLEVSVRETLDGTQIKLSYNKPFGDEALVRSVLSDVLARLGL